MGLRAIIGLLGPLQFMAEGLLRSELRRLQPNAPVLPDACIREFADAAILDARINASGRIAQRGHVVQHIEYRARDIASLLNPNVSSEIVRLSWAGTILRKHGVIP